VKNDSNIFRLQCEPRSCDSRENHHTRLIEYDDRMRQEEKKYARLLMELNKSRFLDQSSPHRSDELNGFATYAVDQTMNEGQSAELEVTRLTGDEILHGCGLTMEQALLKQQKSLMLHDDGSFNRTNTQYSMAFQCTLSLQERNDSRSSLMGMIQVVCSDMVESGEKESIPWQSVMIESDKFDFQGWTGVCSSSLPMSCKENEEEHAIVYNLYQEKQNRNEE
jgi:hypothetical protein